MSDLFDDSPPPYSSSPSFPTSTLPTSKDPPLEKFNKTEDATTQILDTISHILYQSTSSTSSSSSSSSSSSPSKHMVIILPSDAASYTSSSSSSPSSSEETTLAVDPPPDVAVTILHLPLPADDSFSTRHRQQVAPPMALKRVEEGLREGLELDRTPRIVDGKQASGRESAGHVGESRRNGEACREVPMFSAKGGWASGMSGVSGISKATGMGSRKGDWAASGISSNKGSLEVEVECKEVVLRTCDEMGLYGTRCVWGLVVELEMGGGGGGGW